MVGKDLLRRPINKSIMEAGKYNAYIVRVHVVAGAESNPKICNELLLKIQIVLQADFGTVINMSVAPIIDWDRKSEMVKLLRNIDCMPAEGELLDCKTIEGKKVEVTVENHIEGNEMHSAIIRMRSIECSDAHFKYLFQELY